MNAGRNLFTIRQKKKLRQLLIAKLGARNIKNQQVLDAMLKVPRHLFVDNVPADLAYEDRALAIACKQTISQPYVVAMMTEAIMASGPLTKILEIGTGSGYQTAILARLAQRVFTVERIQALQTGASRLLRRLGIRNVQYRYGDGMDGWDEHSPYDAIIVTAGTSSPQVPEHLSRQLKDGGRLIIPTGNANPYYLTLFTKRGQCLLQKSLAAVRFVLLTPGVVAA